MRNDASSVGSLSDAPPDGLGTRAEWLAAGATARMFGDGRLAKVAYGLWGIPPTAEDHAALLVALARRCPPDAVIGGWLAAAIHGVRDAGPTMIQATPQPVTAYLTRATHKAPAGYAALRVDLGPDEIEQIAGFRVTSPTRTAYDMARFLPGVRRAVPLLDCFCWVGSLRPTSVSELAAMIADHPGARGNPLLRESLPLVSTRSRSIPESTLRVRCVNEVGIASGSLLVNPVLQHAGHTYELDLVDADSGVEFEYDGETHAHSRQRSRDSAKDVAISSAGLAVLRVNSPDLGQGTGAFTRMIESRRTWARSIGAHHVVARLLESGALIEAPLTIYPDGGGLAHAIRELAR